MLWSLTQPPNWHPDAVATPAGWADPVTGELLVTIVGLSTFKEPSAHSALVSVSFHTSGALPLGPPAAVQYLVGQTMTMVARFSAPVVVTGTPQVVVSINGTNRTFNYSSKVDKSQLLFTYVTVSADSAAAGQVTITSPLSLNGGTIKDVSNAANSPLTFSGSQILPSVALVSVVGAPTISGVTGISGAYVTGGHILPVVTFTKSVVVTGTPTFPMNIHSTVRNAAYVSGSGTTALTFSYLVVGGDSATAGQFTTGTTLTLAGGSTIKDLTTNNAVLTFSAPTTSAVTVN